MIKAYDFDGVLVTQHKEGWLGKLCWRFFPSTISWMTHRFAKRTGLDFEDGSYIITGRPFIEYRLTLQQMQKWNINGDLVMDETKKRPNRQSSIDWKIKKINELGADEFYEDDDETIRQLQIKTKAKIIKV
jgi:hypothetical protein